MSEQYWSSCLSRTKGDALPTQHPCLPLLPPELRPLGEAHGRPGSVLNAGCWVPSKLLHACGKHTGSEPDFTLFFFSCYLTNIYRRQIFVPDIMSENKEHLSGNTPNSDYITCWSFEGRAGKTTEFLPFGSIFPNRLHTTVIHEPGFLIVGNCLYCLQTGAAGRLPTF